MSSSVTDHVVIHDEAKSGDRKYKEHIFPVLAHQAILAIGKKTDGSKYSLETVHQQFHQARHGERDDPQKYVIVLPGTYAKQKKHVKLLFRHLHGSSAELVAS